MLLIFNRVHPIHRRVTGFGADAAAGFTPKAGGARVFAGCAGLKRMMRFLAFRDKL
jgi:hypothetical protein